MENERHFQFATCLADGAMWLEEVSIRPATRWEPEDVDVDDQPCPVCKSYEATVYPPDTPFGALADAVLYAAQTVGYTIEAFGLPTCGTCGERFYEGWTADGKPLCMRCGEREADECFALEDRR